MGAPAHCVVGAGPGGLVAAATLARAGVPVEVYERHSAVGQRFHGDFQGLENWSSPVNALDRLARLGVRTDFPHRAFTEVTFWDSRLRPTVARTEQPLFYLVRRGTAPDTLDQALLTQASDLGARVLLGRPAHSAPPDSILATGPRHANGLVAGLTFRTGLPDQAHAIVSSRLTPAGYAYLLVWDGRATLAACLFRDLDRGRRALAESVAAFRRVVPGLTVDDARPFGGYGGVRRDLRFADPAGRLYVGEAAGLQDPEWGFGMVTAMASGALAASALLEGSDYARLARATFHRRQQVGFVNRALYEPLPEWLVDRLVRWVAGRPGLPARMRRHWAPSPTKTLLTPAARRIAASRLTSDDTSCHRTGCSCVDCREERRGSPCCPPRTTA